MGFAFGEGGGLLSFWVKRPAIFWESARGSGSSEVWRVSYGRGWTTLGRDWASTVTRVRSGALLISDSVTRPV